MAQPSWMVQHERYQSELRLLSPTTVLCRRKHFYTQSKHIDTFGPSWCLLYSEEKNLLIRNGSSWVKMHGPIVIFVPAGFILETKLEMGWHEWTSVMSIVGHKIAPTQILYLELPHKGNECAAPHSLKDVEHYFHLLNNRGVPIEEQKVSSAIAEKTKKLIWKHSDLTVQQVASHLRSSRSVISRSFKKVYGVSPSQYRLQTRIFLFLALQTQGRSITDSIQEFELSDAKTFIHQFKKFTGLLPKDYRAPKTVRKHFKFRLPPFQ